MEAQLKTVKEELKVHHEEYLQLNGVMNTL